MAKTNRQLSKKKGEKPEIEFILSLHKIKDIYDQCDDLLDTESIEDLAYYYETKKVFSDKDLETLQIKCVTLWQKVLMEICNTIIIKIEGSKKNKKLFPKELKRAKRKKQQVINNSISIGEYEKIYLDEIEDLKGDFESKWEKEKIEWRRFWWGLAIGLGIGAIGIVISIISSK